VVAAPESESCACVVDCIWPGDADRDGRVDMNDLLSVGNKLGTTGAERPYNDPEQWFGQHPSTWYFNGNGVQVEYLDANGDGAITENDVDVIDNYYFRSHDIVVRDVQQKLPYQFSLVPVQFALDSGAVVILDVSLGTPAKPVIDLKGTKFTVNIPPAWMDSASVTVDFHNDSWLAQSNPYISLGKVPWNGRIDAGFSKADGTGASGYGVIGTITFIIVDDAEGFKTGDGPIHIPVSLHDATVMGIDGSLYDVEGADIELTYNRSNGNNSTYELIVYPNPASDNINMIMQGQTDINSVRVIDPQGRAVRNYTNIGLNHFQFDVDDLPVGLYYLQVSHSHGVMTQVLSVIR
jgi:hypothetical protein